MNLPKTYPPDGPPCAWRTLYRHKPEATTKRRLIENNRAILAQSRSRSAPAEQTCHAGRIGRSHHAALGDDGVDEFGRCDIE